MNMLRRPSEFMVRNRDSSALTIEHLQRSVPAIFAAEPHESRSSRYVFVSTRDVMEHLMGQGFVPVEARLSRTRDEGKRGYTKHMIRFRANEIGPKEARRVGDTHFEIVLRNAHDGTGAYDFMAGLFRLVCLNGMTVSDGTVGSVHVKHVGNRDNILQEVAAGAHTVLEQAPKALAAPKLWPTLNLSRDEQMTFAESVHIVRFADSKGEVNTPIKPAQLLHPRRPADQGDDLWSVFNRVQENVTKGGLSAVNRGRYVTTREVRGIDGDLKLNKALWTLGARMAELKLAA